MACAGLVGSICSAFTAYLAVRFLVRFFRSNSLKPFAIYCVGAGLAASVWLEFFV
jgi:undecaprenyl-diphosphatase